MALGDQYCVSIEDREPDAENASWAIWVLSKKEARALAKKLKHRKVSSGPSGIRTAISRKKRAAPLRKVKIKGCDRGLYHGMGRDEPGLKWLKSVCKSAVGYDPHSPDPNRRRKASGPFDVIVSAYTLNVIDSSEGKSVLDEISRRLSKRGRALIAVRRDTCR